MIPIHFIMAMVSLKELKNLNRDVNNPYLNSFRSKYLTASVFKLIGALVIHAGATMIYFNNLGFSLFYFYSYVGLISPSIITFVIGFVIMIIGSSIEKGAWDNLKLFIYYNEDLLPKRIHYDTTAKIENLRSGALSWALGFLVITIAIGWILQLVGYFGLSSVADRLTRPEPIAPSTPRYQPTVPATPHYQPPTPPQEEQPESDIQFCAMCGSKVEKGAIYCLNCGVKIGNYFE
jgi:uncharacterized membrane protein